MIIHSFMIIHSSMIIHPWSSCHGFVVFFCSGRLHGREIIALVVVVLLILSYYSNLLLLLTLLFWIFLGLLVPMMMVMVVVVLFLWFFFWVCSGCFVCPLGVFLFFFLLLRVFSVWDNNAYGGTSLKGLWEKRPPVSQQSPSCLLSSRKITVPRILSASGALGALLQSCTLEARLAEHSSSSSINGSTSPISFQCPPPELPQQVALFVSLFGFLLTHVLPLLAGRNWQLDWTMWITSAKPRERQTDRKFSWELQCSKRPCAFFGGPWRLVTSALGFGWGRAGMESFVMGFCVGSSSWVQGQASVWWWQPEFLVAFELQQPKLLSSWWVSDSSTLP